MEDFDLNQLTEGKTFKKEVKTEKKNSYLITFTLRNTLEIEAIQINNLIMKSFLNNYSFQDIRTNRYFLQFDSLNEIFDELNEIMKNDEIYKKSIEENEKNIMINIQLPVHRNNELFFELKLKNKNDKEKINDLTQLIIKQNEDITDLKNEINQLKNEDIQLKK